MSHQHLDGNARILLRNSSIIPTVFIHPASHHSKYSNIKAFSSCKMRLHPKSWIRLMREFVSTSPRHREDWMYYFKFYNLQTVSSTELTLTVERTRLACFTCHSLRSFLTFDSVGISDTSESSAHKIQSNKHTEITHIYLLILTKLWTFKFLCSEIPNILHF